MYCCAFVGADTGRTRGSCAPTNSLTRRLSVYETVILRSKAVLVRSGHAFTASDEESRWPLSARDSSSWAEASGATDRQAARPLLRMTRFLGNTRRISKHVGAHDTWVRPYKAIDPYTARSRDSAKASISAFIAVGGSSGVALWLEPRKRCRRDIGSAATARSVSTRRTTSPSSLPSPRLARITPGSTEAVKRGTTASPRFGE